MFDRAPGSPGRPAPTRNGARVLLHRGLPLPPTGLLSQARQSSLRFACEEGAKLRSQWHIELAGSGGLGFLILRVLPYTTGPSEQAEEAKGGPHSSSDSSRAEQQQVIFNTTPKLLQFDETPRAVRFNETLRHQPASNFQEFLLKNSM